MSGITPGERKSVHGMKEDLYVGSGIPFGSDSSLDLTPVMCMKAELTTENRLS